MLTQPESLPAAMLRSQSRLVNVRVRPGADALLSCLAFALVIALLVLPGAPSSTFGGTPLSHPARIALAVLLTAGTALVCFRGVARPPLWLVAALVALSVGKVSLASASAPIGWRVEYDLLDAPPMRALFFWRFGAHAYRVEPAVDVIGSRGGMHFLNAMRYSTGVYVAGAREDAVPMRISWTGYFDSRTRPLDAWVSAHGAVRISVEGRGLANLTDPSDVIVPIPGAGGAVREVAIVYDKPAGTSPLMRIGWAGAGPRGPDVAPDRLAATRIDQQALVGHVTSGICLAGILAFLAAAIVPRIRSWQARWDASGTGALAVVVAVGLIIARGVEVSRQWMGQTYFMSSGNDPLAYEGAAREIMTSGLLMVGGTNGQPFYFYPFYSYALAGAHWMIGDDASAIFLANAVFVAATVLFVWILGWRALPAGAAVLGAALLAVFLRHYYWHDAGAYAREAFTDNLYLPMVFATLAAAAWAVRSYRTHAAILTGVLTALTAATRPSMMTYMPVLALAVLALDRPRPISERLRFVVLFGAGVVLGLAPFAARNYAVSGQPVVLVNSWIQIPYFLVPAGETATITGRFSVPPTLAQSLRTAVEVVRDHPWRSVVIELRKILFTLGFTNVSPYQQPLRVVLLLTTCLGVAALLRRRVPRHVALPTAAFALSHLVAMALAAPWSYGFKSILPFAVLGLVWALHLLGSARVDLPAPARSLDGV